MPIFPPDQGLGEDDFIPSMLPPEWQRKWDDLLQERLVDPLVYGGHDILGPAMGAVLSTAALPLTMTTPWGALQGSIKNVGKIGSLDKRIEEQAKKMKDAFKRVEDFTASRIMGRNPTQADYDKHGELVRSFHEARDSAHPKARSIAGFNSPVDTPAPPRYTIRHEAIGFDNGIPFETSTKTYWIYDNKNGEYTFGFDSLRDAMLQADEWEAEDIIAPFKKKD